MSISACQFDKVLHCQEANFLLVPPGSSTGETDGIEVPPGEFVVVDVVDVVGEPVPIVGCPGVVV